MGTSPPTNMSFYGAEIKPGKSVELAFEEQVSTHISQAALGEKVKPGRSVLSVEVDGKKFVICSLTAPSFEMACLDLMFGSTQKVKFSVSGANAVHISGYSIEHDDEDEEMDMYNDEMEEDSEGDEESEEEAPALVPAKKQSPKQSPKQAPKKAIAQEEEDDDEESDEESDDEELDDEELAAAQAALLEEDDEESDEESDEEEAEEEEEESSEEEPTPPPKGKKRGAAVAGFAAAQKGKVAKKAPSPKSSPKAAAKKAPSPKSTPKMSPKIAAKTPSGSDGYEKELKKYLGANGPTNMARMGSAVKKPAGTPKLKEFAKTRPNVFKLSGDVISLK